jgi:hypothetical protein
MQKLISIYLDSRIYNVHHGAGPIGSGDLLSHHGKIEEHLKDELAAGWKIVSTTLSCAAGEMHSVRGWCVVLLEKPG